MSSSQGLFHAQCPAGVNKRAAVAARVQKLQPRGARPELSWLFRCGALIFKAGAERESTLVLLHYVAAKPRKEEQRESSCAKSALDRLTALPTTIERVTK
jgi:hypothetical protein